MVSFLFNLFGYRLVVEYFQYKANIQLEASLDNNLYNDFELIEIKLPFHVPYQSDWSEFQRFDGEIEIGGIIYKYVKRKLANDTLYLKCISNDRKMHLETVKNNYFKATSDFVQNGNNRKTGNSKNLALKILPSEYEILSYLLPTINSLDNYQNRWPILDDANIYSSHRFSSEQPPDFQEA